mmetsp:Transcript_96881/g.168139  ORF Transcript_96881/g.168139 Transcript_96881/m.168139 type:complete len:274 (+) Transcript_96881:203-1024(+)
MRGRPWSRLGSPCHRLIDGTQWVIRWRLWSGHLCQTLATQCLTAGAVWAAGQIEASGIDRKRQPGREAIDHRHQLGREEIGRRRLLSRNAIHRRLHSGQEIPHGEACMEMAKRLAAPALGIVTEQASGAQVYVSAWTRGHQRTHHLRRCHHANLLCDLLDIRRACMVSGARAGLEHPSRHRIVHSLNLRARRRMTACTRRINKRMIWTSSWTWCWTSLPARRRRRSDHQRGQILTRPRSRPLEIVKGVSHQFAVTKWAFGIKRLTTTFCTHCQ